METSEAVEVADTVKEIQGRDRSNFEIKLNFSTALQPKGQSHFDGVDDHLDALKR